MRPLLICASHTISGVMPGDPAVQRHGFEARIAAVAAAGFDGICLHWRDHQQLLARGRGGDDLRAVVEGHALAVPSVEFLGDWHEETPLAAQNRDRAFAAAGAFGARVVNAGIDAADSGLSLEALVDPLRRLVDRAAAQGLAVALEFVGWGACARLDQAVALAGAGGAGLLLDVWHLAWRGVPTADLAAIPPAMVLGLQISDSLAPGHAPVRAATLDRRFPGEGVLDIAGFLDAAARHGWTAPVAVEVISPRAAALDVEICARLAYDSAMPLIDSAWRPDHAG